MSVFANHRLLQCRIAGSSEGGAILLGFAAIWTLWLTLAPGYAPRQRGHVPRILVCLIGGVPIRALPLVSGLCSSSASTAAFPGDLSPSRPSAASTIRSAVVRSSCCRLCHGGNGMSFALIELLAAPGRPGRGGLNIVMVWHVRFSGVPARRWPSVAGRRLGAGFRRRGAPGRAAERKRCAARRVGLRAEFIRPARPHHSGVRCQPVIGGLFRRAWFPAGVMAVALMALAVLAGNSGHRSSRISAARSSPPSSGQCGGHLRAHRHHIRRYRFGFATATESSAYAVLNSIVTVIRFPRADGRPPHPHLHRRGDTLGDGALHHAFAQSVAFR